MLVPLREAKSDPSRLCTRQSPTPHCTITWASARISRRASTARRQCRINQRNRPQVVCIFTQATSCTQVDMDEAIGGGAAPAVSLASKASGTACRLQNYLDCHCCNRGGFEDSDGARMGLEYSVNGTRIWATHSRPCHSTRTKRMQST